MLHLVITATTNKILLFLLSSSCSSLSISGQYEHYMSDYDMNQVCSLYHVIKPHPLLTTPHLSVSSGVSLDQLTASELCHQLALRLSISPTMITRLLRRVVTFLVKIDDIVSHMMIL